MLSMAHHANICWASAMAALLSRRRIKLSNVPCARRRKERLSASLQVIWPVVQCLRSLDWNHALLSEAADQWGHTVKSLHALATTRCRDKLLNLEHLSAVRTKTLLHQLQTSYEALVSRPILQERLKLQNQLMVRDLGAIELPGTGKSS